MGDPEFSPFPVEEYLGRVSRARELMEQAALDALLVSSKENVVYFSGIQTIGWDSKHRPLVVIVPREQSKPVIMVLADSLMQVARETSWVDELRPWGGWRVKDTPADPIEAASRSLAELGLETGKIGLELGYGQRLGMSQVDFTNLRKGLDRIEMADAADLLWKLRMIKSPREIECLRAASAATTAAFEAGFGELHAGMSEKQLAGIMLARMSAETNERPGFLMVRSGLRKYAMMNVLPFDKPMNPGDLVVVDAGAIYRDYWSDFMRMACIGEPSSEQRRFFDGVYEAQQAGVEKVRAGATAHSIYQACMDVLIKRGFKEHATLERVGHGVGLDMHEPPSLAKNSEVVIQPGMVLTVEPVFWDRPQAQIGNFALEDVVVVSEDGCEILSCFPKELHIVPV